MLLANALGAAQINVSNAEEPLALLKKIVAMVQEEDTDAKS